MAAHSEIQFGVGHLLAAVTLAAASMALARLGDVWTTLALVALPVVFWIYRD